MSTSQALQIVQKCLHDNSFLANAYSYFEKATASYPELFLELILVNWSSQSFKTWKLAVLCFKNIVWEFWPWENKELTSRIKEEIVNQVLEETSYSIKNLLAMAIGEISRKEVNEMWDGFIEWVSDALLEEDEIERVDSALRVLLNIMEN